MFNMTINGIAMQFKDAQEAASFVKAMGKGNPAPTGTGATAPKQTTSKPVKLYSTEVKDYEPKKDKDGHYIWQSYKAQRSHFCYAAATAGNCNSNPYGSAWAEAGNTVDYSAEGAYHKAKAEFEATFKYTKKADR